jgi:crotonobetainyl-CoA:carnitine CoA-transferase CaiB-like acyl-CoA transferase
VQVDFVGDSSLTSRFAVGETANACVGAALAAAGTLHRARTGKTLRLTVDRAHISATVRSERYFRTGEQSTGMGFAPLSRFWRARDGWIRTHGNYSWHRDALLRYLEVPNDPDAVASAIADRPAQELEDGIVAAGGIGAAVRSIDEWLAHPQGAAVNAEPLISARHEANAPARSHSPDDRPMAGVRVLDLTRVIAGPVCTRYLGALGAEVLRLDPPQRPDMTRDEPADTLLGKRSALLDATTDDGLDTLRDLLRNADVVVTGYRPGALDRFGLSEAALVDDHPGLVIVVLDAWGHSGPWAQRRGFDSVVQAATGIAVGESADGEDPGALPCQLLDHGTGYLAAAAALDGVRRQCEVGGTHVRRLSLARTAAWLTSTPTLRDADHAVEDGNEAAFVQVVPTPDTTVTAIRPPGDIDGHPLQWPTPLTRYGVDTPSWTTNVGGKRAP